MILQPHPRVLAWIRSPDIAIVLTWLLLFGVALVTRPLLPIDETRYLTVAWEMWLRDSFLVPLLNGAPYSQKPPLLFWLIHAGWGVLGVQEWWGRAVAPLFGLASLIAAHRLARELWPDAPVRAQLVPWLLLGSLWWALFTTLTYFDMPMVFFTIVAMLGLVRVWRGQPALGWSLVALAIGLGALTKGPVIGVYVVPAAVLAPLWMRPERSRWLAYYAGLLAAVTVGTGVGLAWALPAAQAGGSDYAAAILWRQTAGRLAESFAHGRPMWWYLPVLPALLFPWVLWPPVWRGVAKTVTSVDASVRLALTWLLPGLAILSLASGKQPQYLLPLLPAAALLLARGLDEVRIARWHTALPALPVVVAGAALAVVAYWVRENSTIVATWNLPMWAPRVPPIAGMSLAAAGVVAAAAAWWTRRPSAAVTVLALQSVAVVVLFHAVAFRPAGYAYDLRTASNYVFVAQHRIGWTVAVLNEYQGQLGFLGRLERPLRVVTLADSLPWLDGDDARRRLLVVVDEPLPRWMRPEFQQLYRGGAMAIVDYNTWSAYLAWNHPMRKAE